jgi:hypothetical protein
MFDAWMIRREPGRLNLTSLDKQLSAYDVLALARAAATAVAKRQEVVAEAGVDPLSYPIMRDITFLDPSDVTNKQDILCRKGCIIYGLKFARALVLEDVAYIFPDEGFDGEKQIIDGVLHAADPLLVEDSFEYVILSALFSVVVQSFTSQITKQKAAFKVANTMGDNLDMDFEQNAARLREAEQYQVEIDAAMQAVDLHDRGAQGMVISIDPYMKGSKEGEQVKNPRFAAEVSGRGGGALKRKLCFRCKCLQLIFWMLMHSLATFALAHHPHTTHFPHHCTNATFPSPSQVQEIEELFEWCESTLESLKAACVIHLIKLRTEQEKIQQAKTQRHSRLLLIQILIQLVTMAFAFCSMISGFFGMNLSNGACCCPSPHHPIFLSFCTNHPPHLPTFSPTLQAGVARMAARC